MEEGALVEKKPAPAPVGGGDETEEAVSAPLVAPGLSSAVAAQEKTEVPKPSRAKEGPEQGPSSSAPVPRPQVPDMQKEMDKELFGGGELFEPPGDLFGKFTVPESDASRDAQKKPDQNNVSNFRPRNASQPPAPPAEDEVDIDDEGDGIDLSRAA